MYRKRHQKKRGGWPEFLDTALEDAKQKATNLMGTVQQSATSAIGNAQQSAQSAIGNVQQSAESAIGNVQQSAESALGNVGQSDTQYGSGDVTNRFVPEVMLSNQNVPSVQEGGKSRRKRAKRTKRTKRSSVRQRR